MPLVHNLKNTKNGEVALKIYQTNSNGGTIQIELDDPEIKLDSETFVQGTSTIPGSQVTIKELMWGIKHNKFIDLNRVNNKSANTVHGHYFLVNSGIHKFTGFVDDTYANGAIRIVADGPMHLFLVLHKSGYE